MKDNKYLDLNSQYAILPLLRSKGVTQEIMDLSTGSSSSRARISKEAVADINLPLEYFDNKEELEKRSYRILHGANQIFDQLKDFNKMLNGL